MHDCFEGLTTHIIVVDEEAQAHPSGPFLEIKDL